MARPPLPLPPASRKARPQKGVQFSVWTVNGGPVPPEAIQKLEQAIEEALFEMFNDGLRLLTQTTKS